MSFLNPHKQLPALECPPGAEYDEGAFHYFLATEAARAERSNHRLRLLLASLEPVPGKPTVVPRGSANKLFEGLRLALRDTDVMGWYRQGRVAGAVLSTRADAPGWQASDSIEQRVSEGLRRQLPARLAGSLRVRLVQPGLRRVVTE